MKKNYIKSFVKRQGRMTPAQRDAFSKYWSKYGLELSDPISDFFRGSIVDIGFGMGEALLTQALAQPDQRFIGIDVHRPGVGKLLANAADADLCNLQIICHDAVEVLEQAVPDQSLEGVQLFFPDPWPKKRHHKRRLVQVPFVKLIAQKLKPQGYFHIATDWEHYAVHIQAVFDEVNLFLPCEIPSRHASRFEQRGIRLGHTIWDFMFRRD